MRILKHILLICLSVTLCGCAQNWYQQGKQNFRNHRYHQALPKLLMAANNNNHDAQYAVGYMYYNGLGTPADDLLAVYWLDRSAKSQNTQAILALANMNASLKGMPNYKNPKRIARAHVRQLHNKKNRLRTTHKRLDHKSGSHKRKTIQRIPTPKLMRSKTIGEIKK